MEFEGRVTAMKRFGLRVVRLVWASPNSALGLVLGLLCCLFGARWRRVDGVLEAAFESRHRPGCKADARAMSWRAKPWPLPFVAITLGHVVVAANASELERLRVHEHTHVRQYERWGPLFLPAYAMAGLVVWAGGGRAYWDNPFEVEARRTGGC